jgi:hypothetical protein
LFNTFARPACTSKSIRITSFITPKTKDWLPIVGKARWIVLTKDSAIRRRELEKKALLDARVHAFFLASGGITGPEMAAIFLKALPNIEQLVKRSRKPIIAVVHRDGRVSIIAPDSA